MAVGMSSQLIQRPSDSSVFNKLYVEGWKNSIKSGWTFSKHLFSERCLHYLSW